MTDEQREKLRRKIKEWRAIAEPVGPQHALWDTIFDAEALLVGRVTLVPAEKVLALVEDTQ